MRKRSAASGSAVRWCEVSSRSWKKTSAGLSSLRRSNHDPRCAGRSYTNTLGEGLWPRHVSSGRCGVPSEADMARLQSAPQYPGSHAQKLTTQRPRPRQPLRHIGSPARASPAGGRCAGCSPAQSSLSGGQSHRPSSSLHVPPAHTPHREGKEPVQFAPRPGHAAAPPAASPCEPHSTSPAPAIACVLPPATTHAAATAAAARARAAGGRGLARRKRARPDHASDAAVAASSAATGKGAFPSA
mmetsp:Transcript_6395/g.22515  ORF Transcript_6395/g.22515 Transcript_6395/m.22515 type:complete len:243 (-) Transcript_6395:282-1010(-)